MERTLKTKTRETWYKNCAKLYHYMVDNGSLPPGRPETIKIYSWYSAQKCRLSDRNMEPDMKRIMFHIIKNEQAPPTLPSPPEFPDQIQENDEFSEFKTKEWIQQYSTARRVLEKKEGDLSKVPVASRIWVLR